MNSSTMNYSQAEMAVAMNLMGEQMKQLQEWKTQTNENIDQFFLITMGMIIYCKSTLVYNLNKYVVIVILDWIEAYMSIFSRRETQGEYTLSG